MINATLIQRLPRPLIAAAYRGLEAVDAIAVRAHNLRRQDGLALPPMRMRARVGSRGIADFLRGGRSSADALNAAAQRFLGHDVGNSGRVLDFGCGCGRTLRHFAPAPIEGCDVDETAIRWMQRHVDRERFLVNQFNPPLPWPRDAFDLVYSVSIFTHLSERSQLAWLAEIARVLRPGGGALLTVQSEHALRLFLDDALEITSSMAHRLADRAASLAEAGLIFEPYEDHTVRAFPGVTSDYGLTFQTRSYIDRVWREHFDVLGVEIGSVDGLQDVVALRKR
jgi:SAM-dependent methyltransferase